MPEPRPTFAVTFPGQGSQQSGMARALLERCPAARTLLAGLSDAAGEDLVRLAADPDVPAEDLARPRAAHLALVATGLACWRALRQDQEFAPEFASDLAPDLPPRPPRFLAGHSLGEITALACAGALPPDQALALAARRGELLESAAAERPGGMAAIVGPAPEAVEAACAEAMARVPEGELVAAVNYNTPTQTVIAGSPAALAAAEAACARQGARVVRLPVAAAFHTPLVGGAAAPLYDFARTLDWREPEIPVLAGRTGRPHAGAAALPAALALQLASPVRWTAVLGFLARAGVDLVLAAAPARALDRMNAACTPAPAARTWDAPPQPGGRS